VRHHDATKSSGGAEKGRNAVSYLLRLARESQERRKRAFFKQLKDPSEQDRLVDEFCA
jgi:hypothetical protein